MRTSQDESTEVVEPRRSSLTRPELLVVIIVAAVAIAIAVPVLLAH